MVRARSSWFSIWLKVVETVSNRDFLMGIGVGLIISALVITAFPSERSGLEETQIIEAARELGMCFPAEPR